jgi:hypothetical protein
MDFFRPYEEPSRTIYDAFQREAKKRDDCPVESWILNERMAVFNAALEWCKTKGLKPISIDDVKYAEDKAYGSSDYGSKWAYGIADAISEKNT